MKRTSFFLMTSLTPYDKIIFMTTSLVTVLSPQIEQGHHRKNTRDIVINTLAFSILVAAVGLIIHYATHRAWGKMVPISVNSSLSIELIVASAVGLTTFMILTIQIGRKKFLPPLVGIIFARSPSIQQILRYFLHPLGYEKNVVYPNISPSHVRKLLATKEGIEATKVSYQTRDETTLSGYWQFQGKDRPTVICFHGNNCIATDTAAPWGKYFVSLGFNVFLAEYRGYGESGGSAAGRNQELEAYLDAEAALKFVLEKDCDRSTTIAYGFSLGGAYAAALGCFFDIGTVILDHSFTSPQAVAASKARIVSEATCEEAVFQSYQQGSVEADPLMGRQPLVTDRFNSLQKIIKATSTDLFVIQGKEDTLTPKHFGDRFMKEKYKKDPQLCKERLVIVEGAHSSWDFFSGDETSSQAQEQFIHFLFKKDLINHSHLPFFKYTESTLEEESCRIDAQIIAHLRHIEDSKSSEDSTIL